MSPVGSRPMGAAMASLLLALALAGCDSELAPSSDAEGPATDQPTEGGAQAEPMDIELQGVVSMTEFFSLAVPAGWSSAEPVPGGAFVMANSQAALDRHQGGQAVEAGDLVINVGFLPYRLLEANELRGLGFQFDAPLDVFLQSLMPMFKTDAALTFSQAELVSLGNDREAGRMTVSAEGREGIVLMFPAGDRVIALVSAVAAPGGMAQFEAVTYSVASGVTFGGEQDALYGALLGG